VRPCVIATPVKPPSFTCGGLQVSRCASRLAQVFERSGEGLNDCFWGEGDIDQTPVTNLGYEYTVGSSREPSPNRIGALNDRSLPSPAPKAIVSSFVGHSSTAFDFIHVNWPSGGEGGIRTHGTVTRTTVFEFYDSRVGLSRPVANLVLWFANLVSTILPCMLDTVLCRAVGLQFGLQTFYRPERPLMTLGGPRLRRMPAALAKRA